ncbi:hypothetical protein ET475_07730 [Microbacterium protaetiae]|uniref:Uncharacterized protein n=1 Tax=Microbacterium protaetiae TaxID=2509458 RepID=A0A4P6ECD1_9MICO|nr:hypothetical protein [Microbacterium protaetiae]QAY59892.1 hypothetical protein ET475_07730 [Microbacterium protaetiae]
MPDDFLMRIHSPEFTAMSERVLEVTALASRLNVMPFDDEVGKARLFAQILGRALPGVTIGRDSVIAAGAIVAEDVPARTLVAGTKAGIRRTW